MSLKIIQVVHGFPPRSAGGIEIYTRALCRELSKRNSLVLFSRTHDPGKQEYDVQRSKSENLEFFEINNTFKECGSFAEVYRHERIIKKFTEVLEEVRPDVAHIQSLLYLSAGIVSVLKERKIPVVFTLHDYWLMCPQGQLFRDNGEVCDGRPSEKCISCVLYQLGIRKNIPGIYAFFKSKTPGWLFQTVKNLYLAYAKFSYRNDPRTRKLLQDRVDLMRKLAAQVDLFIAPSEFLKKVFTGFGIPAQKIRLLPYGFDLPAPGKVLKSVPPRLRFGFIGNLMPAKGVHVLIRAFNRLPPGAAELKIYGAAFSYKSALGNYAGQLKKMAKGSAVRFMGGFNNGEVGKVFSEIDVLVVPSVWYENSPLVIQEALLNHTPVLASRIGGIPELIRDGENGLLFESGNERDLKEKMESLIWRPSVLNELRKEAFRVRTIEEHAAEIEALYGGLLSPGRG